MYALRHFRVQRNTDIQSNRCTMVTFGKWQRDHYIQGDRYIQVNFAENKRKLKILGSCLVTTIVGRYIKV